MADFEVRYCSFGGLRVLDAGGRDVDGGSYRDIFRRHRYESLDIDPGINVDIVAEDPYRWPIADESYDVVISGQTLEHVEHDGAFVAEVARVLRRGGLYCLIAPGGGPRHCPPDYRRYTRETMIRLAELAGLIVLECVQGTVGKWLDVTAIGRKP